MYNPYKYALDFRIEETVLVIQQNRFLRDYFERFSRTSLHSWYAVKGSGFGRNSPKVRKQSDTECKHKQIDTLAFQNNCVFVRKFSKKMSI